MAKPRKKRSETKALISPAFSEFLNHRLMELIGLVYFAAAFILVAILLSYNPLDESLSHSAFGYTTNWLGPWGAIIADFLYQWIGFAAYILVILLITYGIRYIRNIGLQGRLKLRVLWILPTILGLCFLLQTLNLNINMAQYGIKGLGGATGYLTYHHLMPKLTEAWMINAAITTIGALTLMTLTFALVLRFSFWYRMIKTLFTSIIYAIRWTAARFRSKPNQTDRDIFVDNKRKPKVIMPQQPKKPISAAQRSALRKQKQMQQAQQQKEQRKPTDLKAFFPRKKVDHPEQTPAAFVQEKQSAAPMKPQEQASTSHEIIDKIDKPIAAMAPIQPPKRSDNGHDGHAESFADMVLKKVRAKKRLLRAQMEHDAFVSEAPPEDLMEDEIEELEEIVLKDEDDVAEIILPTAPKPKPQELKQDPPSEAPKETKPILSIKDRLLNSSKPQAPKKKPAPPAASINAQQSWDRYQFPNTYMLTTANKKMLHDKQKIKELEEKALKLEQTLLEFGVKGQIISIRPGPVVTLFELEPAPGTRTSRVVGLSDDIARQMLASSVRVAAVPGKNAIGIEMPNDKRETVWLRSLLEHETFTKTKAKLAVTLGEDIGGHPMVVDLAKMPHLLIAGTTGSGKSVAVNTMILSLLYRLSPEECRLILIDPKMLELSVYENIPHLLTPVVTDPMKAIVSLKWAVREMDDRYRKMAKLGVRNILGYNARIKEALKNGETLSKEVQTGFDDQGRPIMETVEFETQTMPYIVIVIDEVADLMMMGGKQDIEMAVQRLAQKARAAGIHVIMATQRPSVDVITGTIKANFPTRISFAVTSRIDSRTILGEQGAEQLLGMGDMLYMAGGGKLKRAHGPFVSDEEVETIANHVRSQGMPQYVSSVTEEIDDTGKPLSENTNNEQDALYDQALAIILREKKASISFVQRQLSIGYNRAAKIIEQMEAEGVVSPADRVGRREILIEDHTDDPY